MIFWWVKRHFFRGIGATWSNCFMGRECDINWKIHRELLPNTWCAWKSGIFHHMLFTEKVDFNEHYYWLVVSNIFYFPFHIWDNYIILPIDELHHFSRWLLHHQPDSNHWMIMASVTECSDKPCKSRDGSSHCDDLSGAILTKSLKISEVFSYTILIHIYFIHIYFIYIYTIF